MSRSFGSTVTPGRTCCRPLDDHPLARLQAVGDLAQAVVERPQPDGAGDHLVLLVDDVEDLLALVGVDGAVSDQQGVVGLTDGHTDAGEEAGGERLVLVGEHAPHAQGAGSRIDLVVLEIDRALVGKSLLSGQAQRNGPLGLAVRLGLAFADQLANAQHGALVDVEVDVHRVHRHERGEQGAAVLVARLDQVAHRDDVSADAPADRRDDPRVAPGSARPGRDWPWRRRGWPLPLGNRPRTGHILPGRPPRARSGS